MKLKPEQLTAHLKKNLAPIYWVSGDEPFLLQETCDTIRRQAKDQGFAERNVFHVEASFDWNSVVAEANSLSLFADKSMIEIRLGSKKITDAGRKILHKYLASPSPDKIMLLISDKIEGSTLRTKWFQQIESAGVFIQIWPLGLNELPGWIKQRLQQHQLQTDMAGIRLLAERGEGNLLALAQDIEKLTLLYPQGPISIDDIAAVISDNARFDVFSLVDAAVAGDSQRVLRIVRGLKQEGTEAILILWALTREIRMLALVSVALTRGENREQALRQQGVWPRRMPLVNKALQRKGINYWQRLLEFALKIDQMIKGALPGKPWDELERLALALAGVILFARARK